MTLIAVALGSAIGALARFGVSLALLDGMGPGFPWGTLAANGLGSLVIGFVMARCGPGGWQLSASARHFIVTGFCGGFTTFSIFSLETITLWEKAGVGAAAINIAVSLAVWGLAVWAGYRLGRPATGKRVDHSG